MKFRLPYGKGNLQISLPDESDVTVIEPVFIPGLPNPAECLRAALQSPIGCLPLHEQALRANRVGIIFNDITRPTPCALILNAVLEQLCHIPHQNITLFNALGTHRSNTTEELRAILGDDLVDKYRIVQNDCFDPTTQVFLGTTALGHPVWLNRELYECDLKILTGFIEPHFFAGFSGGGKAVMPGMAGLTTILGNHSASMIGHPQATWGVTGGNPIWEEVREVAHQVGKTFLVNVTLNQTKEISGIYCGDLDQAHQMGCASVKGSAMQAVPEPFDIVITTNSGYPLDLNLYQSVKGMSAAAQIVRTGGAIIIAAECSDGLPEYGLYAQLLRAHQHPRQVLDDILSSNETYHDQWQIQVQAMVQLKADVYVHSELSEKQIWDALLIPCPRIEETVTMLMAKYGAHAQICVLPDGPQTIPYLS
jgi:nickel-dependent lactate racemase